MRMHLPTVKFKITLGVTFIVKTRAYIKIYNATKIASSFSNTKLSFHIIKNDAKVNDKFKPNNLHSRRRTYNGL